MFRYLLHELLQLLKKLKIGCGSKNGARNKQVTRSSGFPEI
ncbi:hypothetical protein HMPREF1862_01561 [Varibaculum cambriense]|uniref:Uncharacterized protein n=1 Tax=Varibaculum cambriense TaxID=184870 RepID=A0AB34WYQ7_9ACTO|nr:hypothetical protein HMPREF1862_01561 [Varibaculum cambriense]